MEQANYALRKEKERHAAGREAETGDDAESLIEIDGEGPSQKRKRGNVYPCVPEKPTCRKI